MVIKLMGLLLVFVLGFLVRGWLEYLSEGTLLVSALFLGILLVMVFESVWVWLVDWKEIQWVEWTTLALLDSQ